MIKIDLLKNHPTTIPRLAKIWQEVLWWCACFNYTRLYRTAENPSLKSKALAYIPGLKA